MHDVLSWVGAIGFNGSATPEPSGFCRFSPDGGSMIDPQSIVSWLLAAAFAFGWTLAANHIHRWSPFSRSGGR